MIRVGPTGECIFGLGQGTSNHFTQEDRTQRQWTFGPEAQWRLLLKESVLEFYLDDIFIQSFSLPKGATGQLGVYGSDAYAYTGSIKAWAAAEETHHD